MAPNLGKAIAIIALTGYGREADKANAAGDCHLLRPVNLGKMTEVVVQAVSQKKSCGSTGTVG